MKDRIVPTTRTMSDTSSNSMPNSKTADTRGIDDVKETISQFMDRIAVAKATGDEWIETTPEIVHHYNRAGLGGAEFFIYSGIKVCEHGKLEGILAKESTQIGQTLHGSKEGIIEGR